MCLNEGKPMIPKSNHHNLFITFQGNLPVVKMKTRNKIQIQIYYKFITKITLERVTSAFVVTAFEININLSTNQSTIQQFHCITTLNTNS